MWFCCWIYWSSSCLLNNPNLYGLPSFNSVVSLFIYPLWLNGGLCSLEGFWGLILYNVSINVAERFGLWEALKKLCICWVIMGESILKAILKWLYLRFRVLLCLVIQSIRTSAVFYYKLSDTQIPQIYREANFDVDCQSDKQFLLCSNFSPSLF